MDFRTRLLRITIPDYCGLLYQTIRGDNDIYSPRQLAFNMLNQKTDDSIIQVGYFFVLKGFEVLSFGAEFSGQV